MERDYGIMDKLFFQLVGKVFAGPLQVRDGALIEYLATMLSEFAHRDRLYRLRDAGGRPLEQVAEMLMEGDLLLNAHNFDREREVHKHVGDFTLFVTGIWPEWHERIRHEPRPDALLDYRAAGKQSYLIAASFDHGRYRDEAPVLRRLSAEFELCEYGLHLVRGELDRLGTAPPVM